MGHHAICKQHGCSLADTRHGNCYTATALSNHCICRRSASSFHGFPRKSTGALQRLLQTEHECTSSSYHGCFSNLFLYLNETPTTSMQVTPGRHSHPGRSAWVRHCGSGWEREAMEASKSRTAAAVAGTPRTLTPQDKAERIPAQLQLRPLRARHSLEQHKKDHPQAPEIDLARERRLWLIRTFNRVQWDLPTGGPLSLEVCGHGMALCLHQLVWKF